MPATRKITSTKANGKVSQAEVQSVLAALKRLGSARFREEMSTRYGIVTKDAYGVRMRDMQKVAKKLGRNHALALALWDTGNYEARTVAAFVAEPKRLTPALMDRWCRDFDNWAICDTVCFKLFDQSPHALGRVKSWAERRDEFQKRAAFALLACVPLHDDNPSDETIADCLPLIQRAAADERNFVKKGVSWALRSVATRNAKLKAAAIGLARRLAASPEPAPRWVGKDVLRALK
ncbi:MAG TPA: DNA alkylation repair protein [Verrucomicrobiae bacterium]|nr:DNA alkylation repair protein [Verrucomicrobiae bacterium]